MVATVFGTKISRFWNDCRAPDCQTDYTGIQVPPIRLVGRLFETTLVHDSWNLCIHNKWPHLQSTEPAEKCTVKCKDCHSYPCIGIVLVSIEFLCRVIIGMQSVEYLDNNS